MVLYNIYRGSNIFQFLALVGIESNALLPVHSCYFSYTLAQVEPFFLFFVVHIYSCVHAHYILYMYVCREYCTCMYCYILFILLVCGKLWG